MDENYEVKFTLVPEQANGMAVSNPDMIKMFVGYYNCSPVIPIEYREKIVGENIHASISIAWGDIKQRGMAIIPIKDYDKVKHIPDSVYDEDDQSEDARKLYQVHALHVIASSIADSSLYALVCALRAAGIQCDESRLTRTDDVMFAMANSILWEKGDDWGTGSIKTIWMREQDCKAPTKPNPDDLWGVHSDDDD